MLKPMDKIWLRPIYSHCPPFKATVFSVNGSRFYTLDDNGRPYDRVYDESDRALFVLKTAPDRYLKLYDDKAQHLADLGFLVPVENEPIGTYEFKLLNYEPFPIEDLLLALDT